MKCEKHPEAMPGSDGMGNLVCAPCLRARITELEQGRDRLLVEYVTETTRLRDENTRQVQANNEIAADLAHVRGEFGEVERLRADWADKCKHKDREIARLKATVERVEKWGAKYPQSSSGAEFRAAIADEPKGGDDDE